jgi:hypothetical protein
MCVHGTACCVPAATFPFAEDRLCRRLCVGLRTCACAVGGGRSSPPPCSEELRQLLPEVWGDLGLLDKLSLEPHYARDDDDDDDHEAFESTEPSLLDRALHFIPQ